MNSLWLEVVAGGRQWPGLVPPHMLPSHLRFAVSLKLQLSNARFNRLCKKSPQQWTWGFGQSIFLKDFQVFGRVAGQRVCAHIVKCSQVSITPNQLHYLEWKIDFLWHFSNFPQPISFKVTSLLTFRLLLDFVTSLDVSGWVFATPCYHVFLKQQEWKWWKLFIHDKKCVKLHFQI